MSEQPKKVRSRLVQLDAKRVVVDRLDANVLGLDRNKFLSLDRRLQLRIAVE